LGENVAIRDLGEDFAIQAHGEVISLFKHLEKIKKKSKYNGTNTFFSHFDA